MSVWCIKDPLKGIHMKRWRKRSIICNSHNWKATAFAYLWNANVPSCKQSPEPWLLLIWWQRFTKWIRESGRWCCHLLPELSSAHQFTSQTQTHPTFVTSHAPHWPFRHPALSCVCGSPPFSHTRHGGRCRNTENTPEQGHQASPRSHPGRDNKTLKTTHGWPQEWVGKRPPPPPVCVRRQTAGRDSKQRPDYSHCLKVWSGHQQNKHPGSSPVKCPAVVLPPSSPPSCPRTLSASLSAPQSWPSGQRKLAVTQPGHLRLSYDHQGLTQEVLVQRSSHAETPAGIRLSQRKKNSWFFFLWLCRNFKSCDFCPAGSAIRKKNIISHICAEFHDLLTSLTRFNIRDNSFKGVKNNSFILRQQSLNHSNTIDNSHQALKKYKVSHFYQLTSLLRIPWEEMNRKIKIALICYQAKNKSAH